MCQMTNVPVLYSDAVTKGTASVGRMMMSTALLKTMYIHIFILLVIVLLAHTCVVIAF